MNDISKKVILVILFISDPKGKKSSIHVHGPTANFTVDCKLRIETVNVI